MGGVVDDRVAEELAVGNDVTHVVQRQDRGHEHAHFLHGARHAAAFDEVADAHRTEQLQEHAGGEVAEHAAPGRADGHAGAGQQSREAGGLDAEEAEDGHRQHHPQQRAEDVEQEADQGGIEAGLGEAAAQHLDDHPDQPGADDPEGDCTGKFEQEGHHDRGEHAGDGNRCIRGRIQGWWGCGIGHEARHCQTLVRMLSPMADVNRSGTARLLSPVSLQRWSSGRCCWKGWFGSGSAPSGVLIFARNSAGLWRNGMISMPASMAVEACLCLQAEAVREWGCSGRPCSSGARAGRPALLSPAPAAVPGPAERR